MKILALDLGDAWTGSAITDTQQLIASPYQTIATRDLDQFLSTTIKNENIGIVVVGYPKTLRGTQSAQTDKIVALTQQLEQKFNSVKWELWDERLTSKQAEQLQKSQGKQDKKRIHSIAAAFILQGFLEYQRFNQDI